MYEWDDRKNKSNFNKHGLAFEDAEYVFQDQHITMQDHRQNYGEQRFITFGLLEGRIIVIAHTIRSEKIRIISMRKANQREQKIFEERLKTH